MFDSQTLMEYGISLSAPQPDLDNQIYRYAIIESQRCESLDVWRYGLMKSPPRCEPLFTSTLYESISGGPVFIDLTLAEDAFLTQLYQLAESVPLGCFFSSSANFDECLTLLRGRLTAKTSSAIALFRYFEPRMLLALIAALSDDEKGMLFYKITTIYWFDQSWFLAKIPQPKEKIFQDLTIYQWVMTENTISAMEEIAMMQSHQGESDV